MKLINNLNELKYSEYFSLFNENKIKTKSYNFFKEEEITEIISMIQRHSTSKILFLIPRERNIEEVLYLITEEIEKRKNKLIPKQIIIFKLEVFLHENMGEDKKDLLKKLRQIFEELNKINEEYILYIKSSSEIIFKDEIKYFLNYIIDSYSHTTILALDKEKFERDKQKYTFEYDKFIKYPLKTYNNKNLKKKLIEENKKLESHYKIKCNIEHFNLIINLCKKYSLYSNVKPLETSEILELSFSIAKHNKNKKINTMNIYHALSLLSNIPKYLIKRKENNNSIVKHYKDEKIEYKEILSQIEKSLTHYHNTQEYRKNKVKTLIFLGTTGTGKNYIGKKIADFYCGNQDNLITVDLDLFFGEERVAMEVKQSNSIKEFLYKKVKQQPLSIIYLENSSYASEETLNELALIINQGYIEHNKDKVPLQHTIFIFALTEVGDKVVNKEIGFIKEKIDDTLTIDERLLFIFDLAEELIEFPLPSKGFLIKIAKEKEKDIKKKYKKIYNVNIIFKEIISEYVAENSIKSNNFIHDIKSFYDNTIEHKITELMIENPKKKKLTFDIKEEILTFK